MVGLVTAVLVGSAAGLLAAVVSDHSLIAALIAGVLAAIAVFTALIHSQVSAWRQAALLLDDERGRRRPEADPGQCDDTPSTSSISWIRFEPQRSARGGGSRGH